MSLLKTGYCLDFPITIPSSSNLSVTRFWCQGGLQNCESSRASAVAQFTHSLAEFAVTVGGCRIWGLAHGLAPLTDGSRTGRGFARMEAPAADMARLAPGPLIGDPGSENSDVPPKFHESESARLASSLGEGRVTGGRWLPWSRFGAADADAVDPGVVDGFLVEGYTRRALLRIESASSLSSYTSSGIGVNK
jgi:hypothetical protein